MAVRTVCPIRLFPVIFLQSVLTGYVIPNQQNNQAEMSSQFITQIAKHVSQSGREQRQMAKDGEAERSFAVSRRGPEEPYS